jgi:hypothetical protein
MHRDRASSRNSKGNVRKTAACAYCGRIGCPLEKEHVIPRALYGPSKQFSKVQRITIRACSDCNRGWSKDEPHFRNAMLLAGESNSAVKELWVSKLLPSLEEKDGYSRLLALAQQFVPVVVDGQNRSMIYPHNDRQVTNVLRKIVRGLSSFHGLGDAIPDTHVRILPDIYKLPEDFLPTLTHTHREEDVVQYSFGKGDMDGIRSFWRLTFFERRTFLGIVLEEPVQQE